MAYLVASTYGLNVIKIGGIWIFQGGRSLSALKRPEGVLTIIESISNYGNLAYLVASTYRLNVIKIGGIWIFQGGRSLSALKRPEGVLTIIESISHYGNLAYLVANTYGLNVIKIGSIWIFQWGRSPLLGGLHVTCNAHFRTWLSYSNQKSSV